MAEKYWFFNSAPGDPRKYQAEDFVKYFGIVLSSGLLHTDGTPELFTRVETGTLTTVISPGFAIIKGQLYENTTPLSKVHSVPEVSLDRIDRIVLRLDLRNQNRSLKSFVKEGIPATDPLPPALQRDPFVYELSLAQVRVRANTVQLLPSDLVDERFDSELCGLSTSLLSLPTEVFQQQWNDFLSRVNDEGFALQSDFKQYLSDTRIHKTVRLNIDENGVAQRVEHRRRSDNTLISTTEFSGGESPNYTTRTVKYYATDGVSVIDQAPLPVHYGEDGEFIGEG
ncbi:Uncharacterised protein [Lysinibacillus sphaericus]|nr:Uncharacterised protein [Lysinibacillus sphaericus]